MEQYNSLILKCSDTVIIHYNTNFKKQRVYEINIVYTCHRMRSRSLLRNIREILHTTPCSLDEN